MPTYAPCLDEMIAMSLSQLNRRQALRLGFGAMGLSLPSIMGLQGSARASSKPHRPASDGFGRAKSCIILFAWGGMSHIDTFDPKPDAPEDYRGLFQPVATSVPGVRMTEHLPHLSRQAHRLAIVRSAFHMSSAHGKGMYWNLTGRPARQFEVATNNEATGQDWPTTAALVSKVRGAPTGVPGCAMVPYQMWDNMTRQGGHDAGWLGRAYDPIILKPGCGKPYAGVSRDSGIASLQLPEEVNVSRYTGRRSLLQSMDATTAPSGQFYHYRGLANDMLLSPRIQSALDLEKEGPRIQDKYGPHIGGQSVLLARRLVESGVPVVTVCMGAGDLNGSSGDNWDTHGNNFNRLKNDLLPPYERAFAALLDDLNDRGMLEETLIVSLTDFGRSPKVNKAAGRDHYPNSFSVIYAGGGIKGGQVYGRSDRIGSAPLDLPCRPADLQATIFHALGIDPESTIEDPFGRPISLTDGGRPLPLFGS
jgi:hypothetical protein